MKIIEALKELPVLDKRIRNQAQQIAEYAGYITSEQPAFETVEAQRKKVSELLQSNEDLAKRYASIKRALAITNATIEVDVAGEKKTISEWITYKANTHNQLHQTYSALNLNAANSRLSSSQIDLTEGVKLERMYSEEYRNKKLEEIRNLNDTIDATLEIVNATTDMVSEVL